jgi:hypothetical protein
MKIDDIKLPSDWRDLIEELCDGSSLMLDDRNLQDKLKDAGYAETSVFRRGAITGTDKLRDWWTIHKDDRPATHPATFEEWWASDAPTGADAEMLKLWSKSAWEASRRAGTDID